MKLNIVPARTGLTWVKLGMRTYLQQPLGMSSLFLMFMAVLSLVTMVPFIGPVLALMLLPGASLGLMAAAQDVARGQFSMPALLIGAFRVGRQRLRALALLGALYAFGFLVIMGISALIDGGEFAKLYLLGGLVTQEQVMQGDFQMATWVSMALYLPLALLFWHAPALMHWYGVSPGKSLFFSLMACYKNLGAFVLFGLAWMGIFVGALLAVSVLATLANNPALATLLILPIALLLMAMFFTSLFFTFQGSFLPTPADTPPAGRLLP